MKSDELLEIPMSSELTESTLKSVDPFDLFTLWLSEAMADFPYDADAVSLATSTSAGIPSLRIVYFRGIREGGFSFFTCYSSRKGDEISETSSAAMLFFWPHLMRQVRIEGKIKKLSDKESESYFSQRPIESRISASVSKQSRPLKNLETFDAELAVFKNKMNKNSKTNPVIERPKNWGGYALVPGNFEFWMAGEHRRHKRVVFSREDGKSASAKIAWKTHWLYP